MSMQLHTRGGQNSSNGVEADKPRAAVLSVAGVVLAMGIQGCQRPDLQEANITNQVGGGPINDEAVIQSGKFDLTNDKLDQIRTKMGSFLPGATIHVDRNTPPPVCVVNEACLLLDFLPSVTPDIKSQFVSGFPQPRLQPVHLNSPPTKLEEQVEGTPFELLGDITGLSAYNMTFSHDPAFFPPIFGLSVLTTGGGFFDPNGVFFFTLVDFDDGDDGIYAGDFSCDCGAGGVGNLPLNKCAEVCQKLAAEGVTCDQLRIGIKIDYLETWIGFVPKLPATSEGFWTKDFGGQIFPPPGNV